MYCFKCLVFRRAKAHAQDGDCFELDDDDSIEGPVARNDCNLARSFNESTLVLPNDGRNSFDTFAVDSWTSWYIIFESKCYKFDLLYREIVEGATR